MLIHSMDSVLRHCETKLKPRGVMFLFHKPTSAFCRRFHTYLSSLFGSTIVEIFLLRVERKDFLRVAFPFITYLMDCANVILIFHYLARNKEKRAREQT